MNNFFKLLLSVSVPASMGFVNFFIVLGSSDWYSSLYKPFFDFPSWMLVSIWTILNILIGLSFYYIWQEKDLKEFQAEIFIYLGQLGLSSLWFLIFFGFRNPDFAFIEIFFLLVSVAIFSLKFCRANEKSGCLLVPYVVWVSFIAVLNFSIVILN